MSDNIFAVLLRDMRGDADQKTIARGLRISAQYLCDLEKGRRLPSVKVVERLCEYMGNKKRERARWHLAAARAHGWDVT